MIATMSQNIARLTDHHDSHERTSSIENDLGYEECAPAIRRSSMSMDEEKERRASIKAVLADPNLSPTTKRRSIQHLMDGRRNSSCETSNPCNMMKQSDGAKESDCMESRATGNSQQPSVLQCSSVVPTCNDHTKRAEEMRPHCPHYERNCTLIAPCCGAAFGCRLCHDESTVLYVMKFRCVFESVLSCT